MTRQRAFLAERGPGCLSGRGAVYYQGMRLPIAGRVSMDSITIDITALPEGTLSLGSRVEVLGLWWEDGFSPGRVEGFVDAIPMERVAEVKFAHDLNRPPMTRLRLARAVAVAMLAGTLFLVGIVEAQNDYWYVFVQLPGFLIFTMASLAELVRTPFDMPIADSEIIFGAYTEYTGMKFALFILGEYAGIVALSAVASVLYLGGYLGPILPGPLWMLGKIGGLAFFIIWLRATYPRLREDQLQRFSWIVLTPLALVNILVTAVVKVAI